jgi:hypothetical protein
VPPERVQALRTAFDRTLADAEFVREAERQRAELLPMTGAELARIVDELIAAPVDLRARVKLAIEPSNAVEIAGGARSGE